MCSLKFVSIQVFYFMLLISPSTFVSFGLPFSATSKATWGAFRTHKCNNVLRECFHTCCVEWIQFGLFGYSVFFFSSFSAFLNDVYFKNKNFTCIFFFLFHRSSYFALIFVRADVAVEHHFVVMWVRFVWLV